MLLVTLALAWYFYDSAQWFAKDVQRVSNASAVLSAYQDLSEQTFRTLYGLDELVISSAGSSAVDTMADAETIRSSLAAVEGALAKQAELQNEPVPQQALSDLADIETAVEQVLQALTIIQSALRSNDMEQANAALDRLRSEGVASRFQVLVERVISERRAAVDSTSEQALSQASYVVNLLPFVMSLLIVLTLFVVWRFSRSLKGSMGALHNAVGEFSAGNLQHQIPDISEREFMQLGRAFNRMASQLHEHRTELRESNVRLEAMVDERTRALTDSNEKLARVDEHRRKLLADISHEFRTPLTVIRGESEIALRGKNNTKADYRESFQRIIETSDYASGLVDDLLFIVRADAGEPRLDMRTLEVTELVAGVCDEFAAKASKKNIAIHYRSEADRITVHGDERRLHQVFAILLDNALRYSHAESEIEVLVQSANGELTVAVSDEGIGLSEEEAQLAFERFFRGEAAISHAEQGTGLGLPVAKAIIEAHGGTIQLRGRDDKGTVAWVTLPVEGSLRVVA